MDPDSPDLYGEIRIQEIHGKFAEICHGKKFKLILYFSYFLQFFKYLLFIMSFLSKSDRSIYVICLTLNFGEKLEI